MMTSLAEASELLTFPSLGPRRLIQLFTQRLRQRKSCASVTKMTQSKKNPMRPEYAGESFAEESALRFRNYCIAL